jgi:hypothetical protein
MCSNGVALGPQDGIANEGCPLYMPSDGHYRATAREAIKYWNEFAQALCLQRFGRDRERVRHIVTGGAA